MNHPSVSALPASAQGQDHLEFIKKISASLSPAEVATVVAAEQDFTVAGLAVGDIVVVNGPANSTATALCGARVKAANTLSLTYVNPTAGALTPTAGTFTILQFRTKAAGTS